jgi:hypothetical protein
VNCPTCGMPYVLGSDQHAHCRKIEEARRARDAEIDQMLAWWRARPQEATAVCICMTDDEARDCDVSCGAKP